MSINSHEKRTISRKDDLESAGYVAIKLYTGTTPWVKQLEGRIFDGSVQKEVKYNLIKDIKK